MNMMIWRILLNPKWVMSVNGKINLQVSSTKIVFPTWKSPSYIINLTGMSLLLHILFFFFYVSSWFWKYLTTVSICRFEKYGVFCDAYCLFSKTILHLIIIVCIVMVEPWIKWSKYTNFRKLLIGNGSIVRPSPPGKFNPSSRLQNWVSIKKI